MNKGQNIVIGDESALFALLHADWGDQLQQPRTILNPLLSSAEKLEELRAFNVDNPLYGQKPITILVPTTTRRRTSGDILCRYAPPQLPERSFAQLRPGLYLTSPELTYVRMASFKSEMQLAQIAMNLCARYYLELKSGNICDRSMFLTTPDRLRSFCLATSDIRGSKKALSALRWIYPNSGSPAETTVQLLLTLPLGRGGFGLPMTHMNYDVAAGHLACISEQQGYSVDCANPVEKVGVEYDGQASHSNPSHDKRRRNELKALGWDIYPLEKDTLENPDRMIRFARIVALRLKTRLRQSKHWPAKYLQLRKELGLRS